MAKLSIVAGATSQTVNIFIQDSSVTTGAGLAGLVFNTASLTAYYTFPRAAPVAITLATLVANNSAYSSGGFKEIDATNNKGLYRLDLPNAALAAASGRFVTVLLQGATNMVPCVLEIELTGWDNQDAVHGGLTCLPNTAVTTNASLLTSGVGTDQVSVSAGKVLLQATQAGVTIPTVTTVTNQLTAAAIATGVWQDATAGDFTTASSIGKALYINNIAPGAAGGHFISGSNLGTTTFGALTVTGATTLTGGLTAAITGNIIGNLSGSVGSVTGAVGSVTAGVTVTTNNDKTGYSLTQAFPANFSALAITVGGAVSIGSFAAGSISAATFAAGAINNAAIAANALDSGNLTTALKQSLADTFNTRTMTQAYSTVGAEFTQAQALYDIHQYLFEATITDGPSTSTRTVNKRDQATPAKVFTMNSPGDPTAITETS